MNSLLAHLDGPVTWQIAGSILAILFFGLVVLAILAELANPDRRDR